MKRILLGSMAFIALTFVSCQSEETTEEEVEEITYQMIADDSSLEWKGIANPEYYHTGTITIKDGSVTMAGDSLTGGSFTIDMTSIKSTDLEGEKAQGLEAHLMGLDSNEYHNPMDFFRTKEFSESNVELLSYADGNLKMKLTVVGVTLEREIPATVKLDGVKVNISGDFEMDLSEYGIQSLQADPESGEQKTIEFKLNVNLKK